MSSLLRPARFLFISLAALIAAGPGCGADFGSEGPYANDPPFLDGGGTQGTIHLDSSTQDANSAGGRRIDPRCGSISECDPGKIPDDPLACADYKEKPPPLPPRDGGRQVDGFDAGWVTDGGVSDGGRAPDASLAPPAEAGVKRADGGRDASVEAGHAPPPSVPENPSGSAGEPFACQVSADSNGNASHKCVRSGKGHDGAPCSSTADCRAGFACVGETGAGECRAYCCAMDENPCGAAQDGSTGTSFCGERLLLEPERTPTLRVPVCVPPEQCRLDEDYPCVDRSSGCKCSADLACTVVAGTTGCVKPGTGTVGDACPCAWGYYCSSQNQCMKVCKTAEEGVSSCAPGKCQATAGFPDGFGVCIGLVTLQ
jgi:hypothetical protein